MATLNSGIQNMSEDEILKIASELRRRLLNKEDAIRRRLIKDDEKIVLHVNVIDIGNFRGRGQQNSVFRCEVRREAPSQRLNSQRFSF